MKAICILTALFIFGSPVLSRAEQLLIAFSSNLDDTSGCHRNDPSGADLFTVILDLDDMSVSDLTRITNTPSQGEWFSAISPDGRLVLYNHTRFQPRGQDIVVYDRETGKRKVLLRGARFPHWASNTEFYYTNIRGGQNCYYAKLGDTNLEIIESRQVTSQERCPETKRASDPSPFPNGSQIAFHVLRNSPGAAVAMLDTNGANYQRITPWNSSGHVDVSPSGDLLLFSMASSGGPHVAGRSDNWETPNPLPLSSEPGSWVSYDKRFESVERVGWDYGEWVVDDRRILFSGQGVTGRSTIFSRLFLFTFNGDFTTTEIFDLSSAVEALAGKTGRDFCTASAVAVKNDNQQ